MGERLPTKEQIDAIDDVEALEDLQEALEREIAKIEVDLEFRPGDEEWAARARGALVAHNICFGSIGRRLYRLRRGEPKINGTTPEQLMAKAVKKNASAQKLAAQVEERRVRVQAEANALQKRALDIVERTSWLAMFHTAAFKMLPDETVRQIYESANARHHRAVIQATGAQLERSA